MPYYPKTKRYTKRKSAYRKKRTIRRRTGAVSRPIFPERKLVRLKYNTALTLNPPASGAPVFHDFVSSCYDPDSTTALGDHQPMGFDQLAPFYAKYTVLGMKMTATFGHSNDSSAVYTPYLVGIYKVGAAGHTKPTSVDSLIENGNSNYRWVQLTNINRPTTITSTYSIKKMLSVKDPLDEPNLACTTSANPGKVGVMSVFAAPMNQSDDLPAINVNVCLELIVMCHERLITTLS